MGMPDRVNDVYPIRQIALDITTNAIFAANIETQDFQNGFDIAQSDITSVVILFPNLC